MPRMIPTTTELPALAAPEAARAESDEVEYPEGHWIAQSVAHGDAVGRATAALYDYFRAREDVLVAMELVVYYRRGDNKAKLQPDVQVVFGVEDRDRSSFKIWEEGKPPDFVLEVASPSTAEKDAWHKAREYAGIGVREYWRLDPSGTLQATSLEGYVARRTQFEGVESVGGRMRSGVLGLDLRSERQGRGAVLVFRDPQTGEEFDGAVESAERRRRIAESESRAAKNRASIAEDRASAAEAKLRLAEEQVRALEERFGVDTHHPSPTDRDL